MLWINHLTSTFVQQQMKTLVASLLLCLLTIASASAAPLQTNDIPRATQMGSGPAPDGAPGNGRYFPPTPARPELPTLWVIGDSTVRNGTLADGSNLQQWGW